MPKPFAALDVDGTIFKSSLAEKVVDTCIDAAVFPAEPFNDVYANKRRWQQTNNEGLYQAYLHRLVSTLIQQIEGVEVERFSQAIDTVVQQHSVRRFGFPRLLLRALQDSHFTAAISGSPKTIVDPFLQDLSLDATYGSEFEVDDGKFTGEAAPVGDKMTILSGLVDSGLVSQAGSVAVGDTISDASMLHFAANPIIFNASKTLTDFGAEFGWPRVHEVKDQITVLQWENSLGVYVEGSVDALISSLQV